MAKTLVYEMYSPSWALMAQKINRERIEIERIDQSRGVFTQQRKTQNRTTSALRLMTEHLDRVEELGGVDYIWLTPVYPTGMSDGGYDIIGYTNVDSRFGTLEELDKLIEAAHKKGIKVLMDLVLNHTSTEHPWFRYHPEFYFWSYADRPDWHNLFDNGPAWELAPGLWDEKRRFYLHLFQKSQADLNWFPEGNLNEELVDRFRSIVRFWLERHGVDGFRLDVPQALNKDEDQDVCELADLFYGDHAVDVLNAIFVGSDAPKTVSGEKPFLIMECFDPSYSELIEYYIANTPVDLCLNALLKDAVNEGDDNLWRTLSGYAGTPGLIVDLESHDSPRLPSRLALDGPEDAVQQLFRSGAEAICLYQGQELGLRNPARAVLTDDLMVFLDAATAMRHASGESLQDLRAGSRANARLPLPLEEYDDQRYRLNSVSRMMKYEIKRWKNS